MQSVDSLDMQFTAFITNYVELEQAHQRPQSLNRHRNPAKPVLNKEALTNTAKARLTASNKRYCMIQDAFNGSQKRVIFFNNPLNETIKEELNRSRGFDHNREIMNPSDVYDFDLVVNDSNFDGLVYEKTVDSCLNKVYGNKNMTLMVIGEQYTKKATYFFMKENSTFKKIITALKTKFALFNVSKTNNLKLDLKISVFGIFNSCIYDFLAEESQKSLKDVKLKKMRILTNSQEKLALEKIRGVFGVSKTLGFTGKNGLVIVKLFVNIKDQATKQSFIKSEVNMVVINNVSAQIETLDLIKRMYLTSNNDATGFLSDNRKDLKLSERLSISLSGMKLIEGVIKVDHMRFYLAFNNMYKHKAVNHQLLEWYRQFINEWKHFKGLAGKNKPTVNDELENMLEKVRLASNAKKEEQKKASELINTQLANNPSLHSNYHDEIVRKEQTNLRHSIANNQSLKPNRAHTQPFEHVEEASPKRKKKNQKIIYKSLKTLEDIVYNPVEYEQEKAQYMFNQLNEKINGLKNMLPIKDLVNIEKQLGDLNGRFQE